MTTKYKVGFIGGKFLPLHQGHLYAIIYASTIVDELYVILSSSKKRDKYYCKKSNLPYLSSELRLNWLGEELKEFENIKILHVEDNQGIKDYSWEEGADKIKKLIGKKIDVIFSSEKEYDNHFKKYYDNPNHIIIDNKRNQIPISATKIRNDLYGNWQYLPKAVKKYFVKKIAIVGTESCGKSTLTKNLAKYFKTNYVAETGRNYCEKYSNQLTEAQFNEIAMEHYLKQIKQLDSSNKLLFVDSEAIITKYYYNHYHPNKKSNLINEIIKLQNYDLVLYLEPDVEWFDDGTRFLGEQDIREQNNLQLKDLFCKHKHKFKIIKGDYTQRFLSAKKEINEMMKKENML